MQVLNATGFCPKCGNGYIDVNGEKKCLRCASNRNINESSPTDVKDPGESELQKVFKDIEIAVKPVAVKSGTIDEALKIMKSLPMPDDVKQFKQIKKIIALIEDLQPKG
jgi:hypothetical protein